MSGQPTLFVDQTEPEAAQFNQSSFGCLANVSSSATISGIDTSAIDVMTWSQTNNPSRLALALIQATFQPDTGAIDTHFSITLVETGVSLKSWVYTFNTAHNGADSFLVGGGGQSAFSFIWPFTPTTGAQTYVVRATRVATSQSSGTFSFLSGLAVVLDIGLP